MVLIVIQKKDSHAGLGLWICDLGLYVWDFLTWEILPFNSAEVNPSDFFQIGNLYPAYTSICNADFLPVGNYIQ